MATGSSRTRHPPVARFKATICPRERHHGDPLIHLGPWITHASVTRSTLAICSHTCYDDDRQSRLLLLQPTHPVQIRKRVRLLPRHQRSVPILPLRRRTLMTSTSATGSFTTTTHASASSLTPAFSTHDYHYGVWRSFYYYNRLIQTIHA